MIGMTFEPTEEARRRALLNNRAQFSQPSQSALRVLSLRLPTVLGGRLPTSEDLLKPKPVGGAAREVPSVVSSVARDLGSDTAPYVAASSPSDTTSTQQPPSTPTLPTLQPFGVVGPRAGGNEAQTLASLVNDYTSTRPTDPRLSFDSTAPSDSGPVEPTAPTGETPTNSHISDLLDLLFSGGSRVRDRLV